jgi:hypothetical protein
MSDTHAVLYIAGAADLFHFGHDPYLTSEARLDPDLTTEARLDPDLTL